MKARIVALGLTVILATPALAQRGNEQPAAGMAGSRNMKVMAHIPLGGPIQANDIKIEQELSRPYVYVSGRSHFGYYIIDIKDPTRARLLYKWTIENPTLHQGRALSAMHLKIGGRYYLTQSFQFQAGGPNHDLGAVVHDVTGLPDTTRIREVGRIRAADAPGGFHETYAYKHSNGQALLFTTTSTPYAHVYDIAKTVAGAANSGLVGKVPNPEGVNPASGRAGRGYHDFYVGYDPVNQQDRFFGGGGGGYYVYDVTDLSNPKLIASATGVRGMDNGHTITPDPTGRYAVLESEYQYAPLRIIDFKPAYDGTTNNISRPIGAWTQRWQGLPHNHEVRWPYVFVSGYEDGVQVFNMMDPTNPYTVAYYDTYDGPVLLNKNDPIGNPTGPGGGVTMGSFGIDVRNADGLIVTADMYTGFWMFKMDGFDGWNGHQWGVPNQSSAQDWDNGPDGAPKPQRVS
jgi:hypothetical protein